MNPDDIDIHLHSTTDPTHPSWRPGVLSDGQIKHLCEGHNMIEPFAPAPVRELVSSGGEDAVIDSLSRGDTHPMVVRKVVSYGLGHYGYDMRVSDEFKVFTNVHTTVVDPKRMDESAFVEVEGDCVIPPNSFALARSVECFNIPRDVLAIVIGKSTYARCGIIVNCTPLEPEWRGHVTLEISNTTPLPARIYANEGIAQVVFFKASQVCVTSYADKDGKYQDQPAKIVLPKV